MYVVTLKIKQDEYFNHIADKRFRLINKCHNVLVKHAVALLNVLKYDKEYQSLLSTYRSLESGSKETKAVARQMNQLREELGLSKSGFESYIKKWQRRHSVNISSHQAQKEAYRVYTGAENILFGNGKQLHFRKLSQTSTICGKSPTNGISFDRDSMTFKWMKSVFELEPVDEKNLYMIQALYPLGLEALPISYCEVKRLMFQSGWRYYLHLYIKGTAPVKHAVGLGKAGIDPGTSTMAVAAEHTVMLRELAPQTNRYANQIKKTLRAMDVSRRASNPENYDSEGRVMKRSRTWKKSKRYQSLERKLKMLYRKKAAYVRQSHCILANEVIEQADTVIAEHMNYKALQRRAKETSRQEKPSTITNRKGEDIVVYKLKRKKRFGKSLGSRAPAEFLSILKQKLESVNGLYLETDTNKFEASQYDHTVDKYTKPKLSDRFKTIDGVTVQRDLYSAFLIQHSNHTLDAPDKEACMRDFETFVAMHDKEIQFLKASGQSMPACFGF